MAEIQSFKITNLPRDNHLPFMMTVRDYALESEAVRTQFATLLTAFEAAIDAERRAIHSRRNTDLSKSILKTDEERDATYYVVKHLVNAFLHYHDSQQKTDAQKIEQYLKAVGVDPSAQYDRETGMIRGLVKNLESHCSEEVARLGLTEPVALLKRLNEQMFELLQKRDEQNAQREKNALVDARRVTDRIYHGLVDTVNAYAYIDPKPYLKFIRSMNETIERLNLQVLKITGSTARRNEYDGFQVDWE